MSRTSILGSLGVLVAMSGLVAAAGSPQAPAQTPDLGAVGARPDAAGAGSGTAPTFTRDVAPILYANCVTCHRPGEIAPMSLISYQEARPWARAISKQVHDGVMPPWHADAPTGTFSNERRLSAGEKDILERWAAAGAPEGDPKDLPARPAFAEGWRLGKPDVVFEMTEDYQVPARGTIQYEHFYIPTNFKEVKWLKGVEARPGNRALVHHILVYYEAPLDEPRGAPVLQPNREDSQTPRNTERGQRPQQNNGVPTRLLATYAPGTEPQVFPAGTALRLPPGGVLHLQVHYTANGTAGTDRSKVAMIFAAEPPAEEIRPSQFINGRFTIPAGSTNTEVSTDVGFLQDATVWGLFPHTHVRGKRWSYTLELPDGTKQALLSVPRYDFNWQTYYMFKDPIHVPKGARIISTAWYDNSSANRSNPDPSIDVKWGDQTWEEMQYTGILYSVKRAAPATP
ncbi:MAG TPA: hypothetical protein VKB50_19280 [Vicinamibacterales bacterium]|nr:hypothetical protein [Vicinamibacterales bacterium]